MDRKRILAVTEQLHPIEQAPPLTFSQYIGEGIIALLILGVVNFIVLTLLKKKFNAITAAIFTFMLNGLFVFLFVPYGFAAVYLPILLIYLLIDVLLAEKKQK